MTPDKLRTMTAHVAAVRTAAKCPSYGAALVSACGSLEMLASYFGYRLLASANGAGGCSVHVTGPDGGEFSEVGASLIDCFIATASGPLVERLSAHVRALDADEFSPHPHQDRNEGDLE